MKTIIPTETQARLPLFGRACFPWLVAGLLGPGCGLADYEKRIDQQAARLKIFDEENKYLGPPLLQAESWPFEVFLRLPKDIEIKAAEKPLPFDNFKLHHFPGKPGYVMYGVFVAASGLGDKDKEGKFKEGELSAEEFKRQVRGALHDSLGAKRPLDFKGNPATEKNQRLIPALDDKPAVQLHFDKQIVREPGEGEYALHFELYFNEWKGQRLAAVVFLVPKARAEYADTVKMMDLCLKSLEIGPEAPARRNAYQRLAAKLPPPAKGPSK